MAPGPTLVFAAAITYPEPYEPATSHQVDLRLRVGRMKPCPPFTSGKTNPPSPGLNAIPRIH
jgi:hypothetical protein